MKEKIIELRLDGFTYNQIREKLNCSKSTISHHLNKLGLGGEFLNEDLVEKIKKFRKLGKTYNEILHIIDISKDKLKQICRDENLNVPTNHLPIQKYNDELKYKIIKYYQTTKSLRKTSKEFKIDRTTLRKNFILDENVIHRKKRSIEEKKQGSVKNVIFWRQKVKLKLIEYKGGKCEECGYNKCPQSLQFHHINPKEKDFNISGRTYSFEKMKSEVDKCKMLCANCHIEAHYLITDCKL